MSKHYVYVDQPSKDRLCQGDVLWKHPDLVDILAKYHRHYAEQSSYRYFLVLTQSCGLVRRGSDPPSAHYLTIAAVRSVDDAIRQKARQLQDWWQGPVKLVSSRVFNELVLFTESLLDNNQPNYFYLHEDDASGMSGSNCAFLALSVALRIEHYDKCLAAKIAQLKEPFQAKLGWLAGNMYSRVGTQEWDEHYGHGAARKAASALLQEIFLNVADQKISEGVKELESVKSLDQYSPHEIFEHIRQHKIVPRSTQFSKRAREVINGERFVDRICSRVVAALKQDAQLRKDINEILAEVGVTNIDATREKLQQGLIAASSRSLSDDSLPQREKVVERLVAALAQDAIVKRILS